MKNTIKFLGIIAIVAVIGFSACSSGGAGGGNNTGGNTGGVSGTYSYKDALQDASITFNKPNFTLNGIALNGAVVVVKGMYTVSDDTITCTSVEVNVSGPLANMATDTKTR